MCILAGGWHPDGARPVVVHVGQLVADLLQDVRLQPRVVVHHNVVRGGDRALIK